MCCLFLVRVDTTAALAAATTAPANDMEREVAELLELAGAGDAKKVAEAEELELNKLTVEEARERRERLSK